MALHRYLRHHARGNTGIRRGRQALSQAGLRAGHLLVFAGCPHRTIFNLCGADDHLIVNSYETLVGVDIPMCPLPIASPDIPFISTDQMREVDRAMMEDYKISLFQMMENAGRNLAHLARVRFFDGKPQGMRVVVLAGSGGNGGGGLVCARRLKNWGSVVSVLLSSATYSMTEVPLQQLNILERIEVPITVASSEVELLEADLIVDAIIGYSLRGAPTGAPASLINAANAHAAPVLALDVPSGVDTASGKVYEPAIMAAATMTLALPKEGLRSESARERVGELYLADISVPPSLYARPPLGLEVGEIFAENDILKIW